MALKDIFDFAGDILGISGPAGASRKLLRAVEDNDLFAVKRLIQEQGSAIINMQNGDGNTPLAQAARYGRTEIAEFLIKNRANINRENHAGDTPLILAVRSNRTGIIQALLDNDAMVDRANYQQGETALIAAVRFGDIKTVTMLLDKTKNIDKPDYSKNCALGIAAMRGFAPIVSLLLQRGARIDQKDNKGETPLDIARRYSRAEVVKILEKAAVVGEKIATMETLREQRETSISKQDELYKLFKRRKPPEIKHPSP